MSYVSTHYPKVDATADLYVSITRDDIRRATPKDHCNCAVAQSIKRAVGRPDTAAVIFPSVAYVLMPTDRATARAQFNDVKTGELAWHRFRNTAELNEAILQFDRTGDTEALGYQFHAPSPSQRLRYRRAHNVKSNLDGTRPQKKAKNRPWLRDKNFRVWQEEPGE